MTTKQHIKRVLVFAVILCASLIRPSIAFAAAPAAPTNLSGTRSGQHIVLTWTDNSTNEDRFSIYRKPWNVIPTVWTPVGTVPANTTTFTDTSAAEARIYTYMVQAYATGEGYSSESNWFSIAVTALTPSGLTATANASGVTLKWTNHSTNSPNTQIHRSIAGSGSWFMLVNVPTPGNTYLDATAVPGTTYEYRIIAMANGDAPSAALYVTVTMPTPPTTYKATVNSGTGGGSFAAGATVNITANAAPSGKAFDRWTASGVSLSNPNSTTTSFTMPANAVTVTATYKDLPPSSFAVNVTSDEGGTAKADVTSAQKGDTVKLTVEEYAGYILKEWQVVSGGITIVDNEFTMPANDVTVKAIFEFIYGEEMIDPENPDDNLAPGEGNVDTDNKDDNEKDEFNWLWIVFGGLVLIAVGGGITFFLITRKKNQDTPLAPVASA